MEKIRIFVQIALSYGISYMLTNGDLKKTIKFGTISSSLSILASKIIDDYEKNLSQ